MTAYYNEHDKYAAQWLRNLIADGLIAPGVVDERSIEDVRPDELVGYTQCHFFAGIGIWSHALRQAGWADDRAVWTGSCPCQPFSAAGEGAGFADERHLWPAFFHFIEQCHPAVVLGEQVSGKDAEPWIDLVCDDMESLGYACGALAFPAAGVGCPGIRDRLYWMANATGGGRREERAHAARSAVGDRAQGLTAGLVHGGSAGRLGNAGNEGLAQRIGFPGIPSGAPGTDARQATGVHPGGMANTNGERCGEARQGELSEERAERAQCGGWDNRPGPINGFWRAADWLACTDGKWRPVEPSTFPLAHGAPARVGRLRAYGNAINAIAAEIFIRSVMESMPQKTKDAND